MGLGRGDFQGAGDAPWGRVQDDAGLGKGSCWVMESQLRRGALDAQSRPAGTQAGCETGPSANL